MYALGIRCFKNLFVAVLLINFHHNIVIGQYLEEDVIPDLYNTYKEAVDNDPNTVSLRRLFKQNTEYRVHVKKLKEVNGYKQHNLLVEQKVGSKNPIIYINNPVESKIPNSFLTFEEFKKVLIERVNSKKNAYSILHESVATKSMYINKLELTTMTHEVISTWATTPTTKNNTVDKIDQYLGNVKTENISRLLRSRSNKKILKPHLRALTSSNKKLLKYNKGVSLNGERNKIDTTTFVPTLTILRETTLKPTEVTLKAEPILERVTNIVMDTSPENNNLNISSTVITDKTDTLDAFTHTEPHEVKLNATEKDIGETLEVNNSSVTVSNDVNTSISNNTKANGNDTIETPAEDKKSNMPNRRKTTMTQITLSTTTRMIKRTYNRPRVFIGR